jgi:hypothetical protein
MTSDKVPLLNENGEQRSYEVTRTEPITEMQMQEDGTEIEVITGYEQVGTGQFLQIFTSVEVQETDSEGNLLYWGVVEDPAVRYEPQPSIEITEDDERFVEGLEQAVVLVPIPEEPSVPQIPSLVERVTALEDTVTSILGL